MLKRVAWMMAVASLSGAPAALAQEPRAEAGVTLGWTFSDGVEGQDVRALDGNVYNRVDQPVDRNNMESSVNGLVTELFAVYPTKTAKK